MGRSARWGCLLLALLLGCYEFRGSTDWVPFDTARLMVTNSPKTYRIHSVLKTDGDILDFGTGANGEPRFTDRGIAYLPPGAAETTLDRGVIRGIMVGLWVFRISCPFIYVERNGQWRRVGEPLGGALTAGLARWETVCLGRGPGPLRVMIRNVNSEIQYLDAVKALAVDTKLLAIAKGIDGVAVADRVRAPAKAAADGVDMRAAIADADGRMWSSRYAGGSTRDEVILEFDETPSSPALVLTAGGTLLESDLVGDILRMRGDSLVDWYRRIDTNPAESLVLLHWAAREEIHLLKVEVRTSDGGWATAGFVPSGGPEVLPRRAIPLKLPASPASPLTLRLRPPKGMWAFDEVGLASIVDEKAATRALEPLSGLPAELASADGRFLEMRPASAAIVIEYPALKEDETAFLRIRGYYKVLIEPAGDAAVLRRIETVDGEAVRYAHRRQ